MTTKLIGKVINTEPSGRGFIAPSLKPRPEFYAWHASKDANQPQPTLRRSLPRERMEATSAPPNGSQNQLPRIHLLGTSMNNPCRVEYARLRLVASYIADLHASKKEENRTDEHLSYEDPSGHRRFEGGPVGRPHRSGPCSEDRLGAARGHRGSWFANLCHHLSCPLGRCVTGAETPGRGGARAAG